MPTPAPAPAPAPAPTPTPTPTPTPWRTRWKLFATAAAALIAVALFSNFSSPTGGESDIEDRAADQSTDSFDYGSPDDFSSDGSDELVDEPPSVPAEPSAPVEDEGGLVPVAIADYGVDLAAWRSYLVAVLDAGYLTDSEAAYPENLESVGFTGLAQCDYLQTKSAGQLAQEETDEFGTPLSKTRVFFNAAERLCASSNL